MKPQTIVLLILSIIAACLVGGCISPRTVSAAQPAFTNAVTGVVTPAVPAQVVYVPDTRIAALVSNESALYNQYAPIASTIAPTAAPFITLGQSIFGGIMSIVTGISLLRARRATGVAKTIIQGVESAGPAAAPVKQSIATAALANGNADHVENAVNAIVGSH